MGNLLAKSNRLLGGDTACHICQQECTQQISKLMCELQARKHLRWVNEKEGQVLAHPLAIAQALEQHWSEVTTLGICTLEDGLSFVCKLNHSYEPISLWDTGFPANTDRFQGLVRLSPHLCPLRVPKGGVCGVYSESP